MLEAHRQFLAGLRTLAPAWQLWVMLLMLINGIMPLFFLPDPVALITLVGTLASAALGLTLVRATGFSKLLGLMHAPWLPALAAQLWAFPHVGLGSVYAIWLSAAIAVTTISLVIDALDVRAWFRQQRR